MNITAELQKLADLRQAGHLSEAEFVEAKRRLLADPEHETAETDDRASAASHLPEERYRSSRWSSGNFFFPDSLTVAADGLVFRKGALFGSTEEHINYNAVASVRTKNGFFLANLTIETSGGSQPIFINGLWKSEARAIQESIRIFQQRG